ncbi:MAG: glycosyltransferase family 39 protein [Anaerolineaceae bacterium]|nr:glycosyltransferase family 39 protein [Anaerolineaceae bacterium]
MSRFDYTALLISIVAVLVSLFISGNIFDRIPHIEDEITYVWQARLAAQEDLTIPSPVCPNCFLEPFVIDLEGVRFGKYPPGWPVVLSFGIRLGMRHLVNPLLSGFTVWLTYLLVKKVTDEKTGLLSAALITTSPFFLMNSGSLLAHPWALLLSIIFIHAWLDTFDSQRADVPKWVCVLVAGAALGLLVLTRPLTAFGLCLPFVVHGLIILLRGTSLDRKNVLLIGVITICISGLYLVWQFALTGDLFKNPYILYWPYDKIGFGPGFGLNKGGHSLRHAYTNTKFSLQVGTSDLFGWPRISWIFLPFGIIALRKNWRGLMISSVFVSMVISYGAYWIGSWLLGPRYYYEGLFSLILLTAAGIRWLACKSSESINSGSMQTFHRIRYIIITMLVCLLMIGNFFYYLPLRLGNLRGLYGISSSQLSPFEAFERESLTPALVLVDPHKVWLEYGGLLDLSSPYLNTPFIFIYDREAELNQMVIDLYPDRKVWYYYPEEPYSLFREPRD